VKKELINRKERKEQRQWVAAKMTAETRRRREKYFNHGWTRMDADKKTRGCAEWREFFGDDFPRGFCFPTGSERRHHENIKLLTLPLTQIAACRQAGGGVISAH
jgi:hypothetical protein